MDGFVGDQVTFVNFLTENLVSSRSTDAIGDVDVLEVLVEIHDCNQLVDIVAIVSTRHANMRRQIGMLTLALVVEVVVVVVVANQMVNHVLAIVGRVVVLLHKDSDEMEGNFAFTVEESEVGGNEIKDYYLT